MNTQQNAVDFMFNELTKLGYLITLSPKAINVIQQAKQLEKQQIIDAGNKCCMKKHLHDDMLDKMTPDELTEYINKDVLTYGEEYYNETYKK